MAKFNTVKLRNGEEIQLTDRELMFCQLYVADPQRNGTQSAIKAGYSETSARRIATENLSKHHIQKYIHDQTAPILDAIGATRERLLQEWVKIGLSDISDYMDEDWKLRNLSDIRQAARGAIESIQVDERVLQDGEDGAGRVLDRSIKVKLHNKIKALERLSEIHGILPRAGMEAASQPETVNFLQQVNNYYQGK